MLYPCTFLLCLRLAGKLCNLDDDKFGGFERGKGNDDVDDAIIYIGLSRRRSVAFDLKGLAGFLSLECPLVEKGEHEGLDAGADGHPKRSIVRLKNHPTQAAVERLLDKQCHAAHRDVAPLLECRIRGLRCAGTEDDRANAWESAQAVYS